VLGLDNAHGDVGQRHPDRSIFVGPLPGLTQHAIIASVSEYPSMMRPPVKPSNRFLVSARSAAAPERQLDGAEVDLPPLDLLVSEQRDEERGHRGEERRTRSLNRRDGSSMSRGFGTSASGW
jgi:hypothetical protein